MWADTKMLLNYRGFNNTILLVYTDITLDYLIVYKELYDS